MERIARLLLFLLPFLLTGCTAEPAGEIRVGLPVLPSILNPLYATDAASVRIGRLLFGSLVEFDSRDRPVPGIAEWQRPGPRHYRFVLRERRRPFSNGEVLSAEDVAATYGAVLDPRRGSPHRANLGMIERIEAVDARTLDFFLSRPDPHFPAYLTIGILPRALLAKESLADADLIGNGPFRYLAGEARSRLRLERIDDGQVLEFLLVKDPVVRALKLR
ncbi:MAG: ABC transporter substrate-binding protein, partial [Pseudomonadota bacterium]